MWEGGAEGACIKSTILLEEPKESKALTADLVIQASLLFRQQIDPFEQAHFLKIAAATFPKGLNFECSQGGVLFLDGGVIG